MHVSRMNGMRWIRTLLMATAWLLAVAIPVPLHAEAIPVELVQLENGGWQLLRGGEPYFVQGAGGSGPKDLLAQCGANTFRTWGVGPDLGDQLDEAHRLGLAVIVGHWLEHERHGFDYNAFDSVAEQFDRVRRDVLAYKDHPAVLMWAIGNEMEGYGDADNAAVWSHVQAVAAMVKRLDPHHPTLTVTADIGGKRVEAVHTLCPDIDIMGINSYGGLSSIPQRYRQAGGTKPYLVTEFGPRGVWEIEKTAFDAPPELTSTEKAFVYRDAYGQGCLDEADLCLGGIAFTWGYKMEATRTWFGMLLPNGDKLAAVDAMTEIWSGKPPDNLCPVVRSFALRGSDVVQPGDRVEVLLEIADPEGAPVEVQWEVRAEASTYITGGDHQALPLALDGVIVESSDRGATLAMPGGGVYRLYMTASDGAGAGATASVPILVEGDPTPNRLRMPVVVHADGEPEPWSPSGWMGGHEDLTLNAACTDSPYRGETCLEFTYNFTGHWVGVAWQHPANDWGELPGGYDLTGATKLTFWARGKDGGETVSFGVGLLGSDKPHSDSVNSKRKEVKLKTQWRQYSIDLGKEDLSRVKTGFVWTLSGQGRPITFYLDDIRFE